MSETTPETPVKDRIRHALEDLANRITIGFEVETQCESQDREPDYEAMREHAEEQIDEITVCSYAGVPYSQKWIDALSCENAEELAEKLYADCDAIVQSYVDGMDESDWIPEADDDDDDWDGAGRDVLRRMGRKLGLDISGWEHKQDGSVSGPEFASPICHGREDAIKHATALFGGIDKNGNLRIDDECSCHIHLRMEDVYHKGHNLLQQLLFEELFNDLAIIPNCIKERCAAIPRWIQPSANGKSTFTGKYNPIQRHGEFGTWEFRIFGNVNNAEDFTKCLDAALAAMRRAYARFLEGDRKELPADLWAALASRAMANWRPIQDAPEYGKYLEKPAEDVADIVRVVVDGTTPVAYFIRGEASGDCDCPSCLIDRRRAYFGDTIQVQNGRRIVNTDAFIPIQEPELATIS